MMPISRELLLEGGGDGDAIEDGIDRDAGEDGALLQRDAELFVGLEEFGIDFVEALGASALVLGAA